MIGALVELVADPLPHARGIEQLPGPGDQIVEIGHALGPLGADIGTGEGLSRTKPGGLRFRQFGRANQGPEPDQPVGEIGREIIIFGLRGSLVGRGFARLSLCRDKS